MLFFARNLLTTEDHEQIQEAFTPLVMSGISCTFKISNEKDFKTTLMPTTFFSILKKSYIPCRTLTHSILKMPGGTYLGYSRHLYRMTICCSFMKYT